MKKLFEPISTNITKFQENFKKTVKPFSWQTALLLSLLAWLVYLLVQDPGARQFVSLYGWFFLIIGTDWFFKDDKDDKKKLKIPGLKLMIDYGPWITGALIVLAFYSNRLLIQDLSTALVSWPLVSVGVIALPQFLKPDIAPRQNFFTVPAKANVRQNLVVTALIGGLLSCWFQFHFLLQNILQQYPSIVGDDFSESAFVVRVNPFRPTPAGGTSLLNFAEAEVRENLNGRSWLDVQRWLRNIDTQIPQIESAIKQEVYGTTRSEESRFWRLNANFEDAVPDDILTLRMFWLGPSSQDSGYALEKQCFVRRSPTASASVATPGDGNAYEMDCRPISSTLPTPASPERDTADEGSIIEY